MRLSKARAWVLLGAALACGALLAACAAQRGAGPHSEPAAEPAAYAVKVGYKEADKGERAIASKADWDAFVESMADVYYDGDGNEEVVPCKGFKEYDEKFFDEGNTLLVAYEDLGSGSYDPKITGVDLDGETLTTTCDMGEPGDALVTADMSGFVTVVEVPKGVTIRAWNR